MARHRDRLEDAQAGADPDSLLPADIAAGPDPALWPSALAWRTAGEKWSHEHLDSRTAWRALLPDDVAYAVSALGRAHARAGAGYRPPWE